MFQNVSEIRSCKKASAFDYFKFFWPSLIFAVARIGYLSLIEVPIGTLFGCTPAFWRIDNQHNNPQHKDIQHKDTQHKDTQNKDTKHKDTKHKDT